MRISVRYMRGTGMRDRIWLVDVWDSEEKQGEGGAVKITGLILNLKHKLTRES